MNVSKPLSLLCILFFITACSLETPFLNSSLSQSTGQIVFPVLGVRFMGKRSNTYVGVDLMLKNQKNGQLHTSLMTFKDGKRIEVMGNLTLGVYV